MVLWISCLLSVVAAFVFFVVLITGFTHEINDGPWDGYVRNGLENVYQFEWTILAVLSLFIVIEIGGLLSCKLFPTKFSVMLPRLILVIGLAFANIFLLQQLQSTKVAMIYIGLHFFRYVVLVSCVSSLICINQERTNWINYHAFSCSWISFLLQVFACAAAMSNNEGCKIVGTLCWFIVLIQMVMLIWAINYYQSSKPDFTLVSYAVLLLGNLLADTFIMRSHGVAFTSMRIPNPEIVGLEFAMQTGFLVAFVIIPAFVSTIEYFLKLQKALDEQGTFMRYMSHEMRTPLNIMNLSLGFVETEAGTLKTLLDPKLVAPMLDAISDIKGSCQTATSILDDFLTLDKMQGGKMSVELLDVDPQRFLWETFRQFTLIAQQSEINFKFICNETEAGWYRDVCLRLDAMKFAQVMRNLLSNAFKFTPARGAVTLRVSRIPAPAAAARTLVGGSVPMSNAESSLSIRGGGVRSGGGAASFGGSNRSSSVSPDDRISDYNFLIEVVDSGAGISAPNQEKMFGQYVQFNASQLQKGGGSGLGLWISRGIAELHGGRLWVESEGEGLGSTFKVELPMFPKVNSNPVSVRDVSDGNGSSHEQQHSQQEPPYEQELVPRERLASSDHSLDSNGERRIKLSGSGSVSSKHSGSSGGKSFLEEAGFLEVRQGSHVSRSSSSRQSQDSSGSASSKPPGANASFSQLGSVGALRIFANAAIRQVQAEFSPVIESARESETCFAGRSRASSSSERRNSDALEGFAACPTDLPCIQSIADDSMGMPDASFNTLVAIDGSLASIGGIAIEDAEDTATPSSNGNSPAKSRKSGRIKEATQANTSELTPSAAPSAAAAAAAASRWSQGLRIMIVDDSTPSRKILRRMIARHGHKVFEAIGGNELLQKMEAPLSPVREEGDGEQWMPFSDVFSDGGKGASPGYNGLEFDIILMDHHMPKMNGPETTRRIRERGYSGLIVGMAGVTLTSDVDFFKSRGADHVLRKPVDINELKAIAERDLSEVSEMARIRNWQRQDRILGWTADDSDGGKESEGESDLEQGRGRLSPTKRRAERAKSPASAGAAAGGGTATGGAAGGSGRSRRRSSKNSKVDVKGELEDFQRAVEASSQPSPRKMLSWDKGLRFLVVDDSISNRKVLKRLLLSKGHTVTDAEDGQDCLEIIEATTAQLEADRRAALGKASQAAQGNPAAPRGPQEAFDVVLMDWHMPKMNGPDAVKNLRARGYRGLIVGITGDTDERDIEHFRSQGANVVLSKPIRVDDLKAAVEAHSN